MKKTVSLFIVIAFVTIIVFAAPQEARADLEGAQNTSNTLMILALACAFGALAFAFIPKSNKKNDQAGAFDTEGNLLALSDYQAGNLNMNSSQLLSEETPGNNVEQLISFSYNF